MDLSRQNRGQNDDPSDRPRASPAIEGPDDVLYPPISGVSIEVYVSILRSLADVGYDATKGPELAALEGIGEEDWDAAIAGWNARMHDEPAAAHRFNVLYTQR